MKQKNLFWKKLSPLAFPIAMQQLMLSLVSASDALMLGLVDQSSLAAVSLATQIQFVFGLFMSGFTNGGSILAAQYWGKGSKENVEQTFGLMMRPAMFTGFLFTAAACMVPQLLMRIFTPDPELIRLGAGYLRMVSLSYILYAVSMSYLCIMRNSGRTGVASVVVSIGVIVNIGLNGILIFGLLGAPKMGIQGAALATVITRGLELLCCLWEMQKPNRIKLRKEYFLGKKQPLLRDYIRHMTPVTGNFLVWGVGVTMGSVILGRLGADAVAANSIASVMKNLVSCFCMGFASGGAILVGNELGAGELAKAKVYGGKVVRLALVSGVISCTVLITLTPIILCAAELTPQAAEYVRWMIAVCGVNLIGMSNNSAIISGIFSSGGDTKFGFICDSITLWLVVVPLGLLAAFVLEWPVMAVYCIICSDEIIKLPAVWKHYFQYKWVRDLTIQE